MRKLLFLFSALFITANLSAQSDTTYWKTDGDFSIQFNQVNFSNWATGGDNSYAGVIGLNYAFNYQKAKTIWENKLILSYGMQNLAGDFRKTEDKIDFASKYGYQLGKKTYLSTLFSLKSQFANGYNYPNTTNYISKFAAPLYIGLGVGLDYKVNDYFSIYASPSTLQWVIISDNYLANLGVFGNAAGENVRTQFGANLKIQFKKDIAKNINLDTKLELFSDYLNKPQNMIVNWDMVLDLKVNKLISAKLTTGLIYDDNINIMDANGNVLGPRTQFKEMFGAGLSVKF
jgi:hypothetical protein